MNWWNYARRPSAAENRQRALRAGQRLSKSGSRLSPVVLTGRTIAASFWGKAWCEHLESYRDYENRLPRGRSYVRNRAVLDLRIERGRIAALVSGSDLYRVNIAIEPLAKVRLSRLKSRCGGEVGSLIELLEGRLSDRVMQVVTHRDEGLFPRPAEIRLTCSCPDWAVLCKHVAAVLYGVGARLDREPELLFTLRGVDHGELISSAAAIEVTRRSPGRKTLAEHELAGVFGIELAGSESDGAPVSAPVSAPGSTLAPAAPASPARPSRAAARRASPRVASRPGRPRRSGAKVPVRSAAGPRTARKIRKGR